MNPFCRRFAQAVRDESDQAQSRRARAGRYAQVGMERSLLSENVGGTAMTSRRALLVCGVLSSLVYVGIDQLAAVRHPGYHDFASQTISELGARGAPTRQLVNPMFILYDLLTIAFGVGVWLAARGNRPLRVVAAALTAVGVVGLPGPWLFPMNLRG